MYEFGTDSKTTDEELIALLMAISAVSKRLARKLEWISRTGRSQEGGYRYGQAARNGRDRQQETGYHCLY